MSVIRRFHGAIGLALGLAGASSAMAAASVELVLDTNSAVIARSSNPGGYSRLGNQALFVTSDGNSWELWRSNGTASGTVSVRSGENLQYALIGEPFNGRALMHVQDQTDNHSVWSTDGTTAGTRSLFQVSTQGQTGDYFLLLGETASHQMLIWSAVPQGGGWRVWTTDGTPAGTSSIPVNIRAVKQYAGGYVIAPVVRGNRVFLQAQNPITGFWEVWQTDGTAANTSRIADTDPDTGNGGDQLLGADANFVYFLARNDATTGQEIWRFDIATGNTRLLLDFAPGTNDSQVVWLETVPGGVVFLADHSLWFTTSSGMGLVQLASFNDVPTVLGHAGARVLFKGRGVPDDGQELWSTDGTVAGTLRVRDHSAGQGDTNVYLGAKLSADRVLVQLNYDDAQLWSTDGTPAGTRRMVASANVSFGSDPVFAVANEGNDTRLWKIDPVTEAATVMPSPTYGPYLLPMGQRVLFVGYNATTGIEPWISDGTVAGTQMLLDIESQTGNESGRVDKLTTAGSIAMFEAFDPTHGIELWKTDGTAAGTSLVVDVKPGAENSTVQHPKTAGSQFFFQTFDALGFSMWRSDGTGAGSTAVRDAVPTRFQFAAEGSPFECDNWVAALGSLTLFATVTADSHAQLWSTDGTTAGTRIVNAAAHPAGTGQICDLSTHGSLVYYRATFNGLPQLFRSDGTQAGTFQITGLTAGSGWANPPVSIGARAYFLVDNQGTRLWSTDGTLNGTQPFAPGGNPAGLPALSIVGVLDGALIVQVPSSPSSIVARLDLSTGALTTLMTPGTSVGAGVLTGGRLFFPCADVCVTDGTAAGTRRVRELESGVQRAGPLLAYNGAAYFISYAPGSFGHELWKTDGTPAGTVRVSADATDTSIEITQPAIAGGRVVFGMDDAATGRELWRVTSGVPTATADNANINTGAVANIDVLANDVDSDGRLVIDALVITAQPTNGSVAVQPNGTLRYTPQTGFVGTDTFKYRIADDSGASAESTVTIRVDALAGPPSAPNDGGGGGRFDLLMLLLLGATCALRASVRARKCRPASVRIRATQPKKERRSIFAPVPG